MYLNQDKDVGKWQEDIYVHKSGWLEAVQKIIDKAVENGYLERVENIYRCKEGMKEVLLFWLDVRLANSYKSDSLNDKLEEAKLKGVTSCQNERSKSNISLFLLCLYKH